MNSNISNALIFGLVCGCFAWLVLSTFELPEVHFSYTTDQCIKVLNFNDDQFSCENMPDKFHHVWVK